MRRICKSQWLPTRLLRSSLQRRRRFCSEATDLMGWYDRHDIASTKLCVRTPDGGIRGLFALESISAFETLAVIPPHMIIQSPYNDLEGIIEVRLFVHFKALSSTNSCVAQNRGQQLDQQAKHSMISTIQIMPNQIRRKFLLAMRLLELLHTDPEIWMPYKKLCLDQRIPTLFTMTAHEMHEFLRKMPITLSSKELTEYEARRVMTQQTFQDFIPAVLRMLGLLLPSVEFDPTDITWAFTVAQTRAGISIGGRANTLIPLFDMLNHAASPTCLLLSPPHHAPPPALAKIALQADPARLRLASAPGEPAALERCGRRIGRLEDCAVLVGPAAGARAGDELRLRYHDTSAGARQNNVLFALTYGFYPEA